MPEGGVDDKSGIFTHPSQLRDEALEGLTSLSKILLQYDNLLALLRKEWRGESLYTDSSSKMIWVQTQKPIFTKNDLEGIPIKIKNEQGKEEFLPNDEAIDSILNILKFTGINKVTPITNISENEIIDDLKEIECKMAALLCLKQKEWGIDKEMLPIIHVDLKTMIKDARYLAKEGNLLKAVTRSVQEVIQQIIGEKRVGTKQMMATPYK